MGMELIKRIVIFSLLSVAMLFSGCIGETTNHSQRQGEVAVNNTESHSNTVEKSAGGISSSPEREKDETEPQTSPGKEESNESSEGVDKTVDEQQSPNQHDDGKSVSKSDSSVIDDSSESSITDEDKGTDDLFVNKNILVLGGALIALVSIMGWRLFRGRDRENNIVDEKAQADLNVRRSTNGIFKPNFRVGNLHNIGRRDEQQDSFCISDVNDVVSVESKGIMAVVADGMGGLEGGAAISQLVADTFLAAYDRNEEISSPSDFLYETAKAAETVAEKYMKRNGVDGGSTLVSVLICGNELNFLSVGDSHIYLFTAGRIMLLNKEHNFAAVLKEKADRGEVAPDEPYVNPRRNSLTAYIGMGSFQIMDTNDKPIVLVPGDKVLLCSDGVFNTLKEVEIEDILTEDAIAAAKRMEAAVMAKNNSKQDNFTGIIVEYVDEEG